MKATGIVRRIDELGRIVIPMELRKQLGISNGASLEIFTDTEGHIILKKYDQMPEILNQVKTLQEIIKDSIDYEPEVTKKAVNILLELEHLMKKAE